MDQFEYIGGDPALDLVNTVDWTPEGPRSERLRDFESLTAWASGAGLLSSDEARRLQRPPPSAEDRDRTFEAALHLRRLLRHLFMTLATDGALPEGEELEAFNRLLRRASASLEIASGEGSGSGAVARWQWRVNGDVSGERIVWEVARSAAKLLTSDEAMAIRVCPGEDCGWLFVDRSRNGLRRWCQMKTCGTRAKNRRRAAR